MYDFENSPEPAANSGDRGAWKCVQRRVLKTQRQRAVARSTARDNFYDFQPVPGGKAALRKFGGSDGISVVFDDDAARQKFLRNQEFLN